MSARGGTSGSETRKSNPTVIPVGSVIESGLLWYINATAFHPQGLALSYDEDKGDWFIQSSGPDEQFTFPDDGYMHARYQAVQELFAQARKAYEENT